MDPKIHRLLNLCEFVIFEFQPIAHVDAKGQQGNGNLGNYAGIIIFQKRVISPDINDGTKHGVLLYRIKLVKARLSYSGSP